MAEGEGLMIRLLLTVWALAAALEHGAPAAVHTPLMLIIASYVLEAVVDWLQLPLDPAPKPPPGPANRPPEPPPPAPFGPPTF